MIRTPFNSASCFKTSKSALLNTSFTDTLALSAFCRSLYSLERQLVPQVLVWDRLFTSGVLQQVQRFVLGTGYPPDEVIVVVFVDHVCYLAQ